MNMRKHSPLAFSLAAAAFCLPAYAGDPSTDVWPKPQKVDLASPAAISAEQLDAASVKNFLPLVEAFKSSKLRPNGKIAIQTTSGEAAKSALNAAGVAAVPGAYLLKVAADGISIVAADSDGVFYASQTLAQMIAADGKLTPCTVADWPDMPFRGSIEGFYGKPWEHARRLSQIQFYGKYKMNAYIYGPKDDPYSGFNSGHWRDEYPAAQATQITELVKEAKANHVNFIWAMHPGSSIRWDDKDNDGTPDDVIVAMKKLEAMYQLGVRAFAVFFDDIGGEGAKAEMQAKMLNHINREFIKKKNDVAPLLMCPTDYAGANGSDYKKSLGSALDKDINIMWTGPGICSDIPANAVKEVSTSWQRKPFIWWNWPVNDYCRTNLLLGRTYGLDKGNKGQLAGFASNPMDKPEASKVGLFSIANWAWNVDGFDSEKSWEATFPLLFPETPEAMFVFAKHNSDQGKNGHGYRREESVAIKPAVDKALEHYRTAKKLDPADADTLSKEFAAISAAADKLTATLPKSDPALWHEIEFWVRSFGALGKQGTAAITLASGKAGDGAAHMALFSVIAEAQAQQKDFFEAQKKRHFAETFPSDQQWATGIKVSTLVLTPLVEELFQAEWEKAYALMGGKPGTSNAVYKAFATADGLKDLQAEREGKFVSLRRILEVVKLAPKQHIGLALPEGVFATYIHVKLDNPQAADACGIEVSTDGKSWQPFNAKKGNGELHNDVSLNDKVRFFRLVNTSAKTVEFRINQFKFDVPADAQDNSIAAATDGNPATFYTLDAPQTFTGPATAKSSFLVTNASDGSIKKSGNKVTITPSQGGSTRVFEIIWR